MATWRRKRRDGERRKRERGKDGWVGGREGGGREGATESPEERKRRLVAEGRDFREWRRGMGVRSAFSSSNGTDGTVEGRGGVASGITHRHLP